MGVKLIIQNKTKKIVSYVIVLGIILISNDTGTYEDQN